MMVQNMVLVGSTARNTGKTTFCTKLIQKWKDNVNIIGIKVTIIRGEKGVCHHGDKGCGVCTSIKGNYDIIEETDQNGSKDTHKLLGAGAKKVFWVRTLSAFTEEAISTLLTKIPKTAVIVCESNGLSEVITPGVKVLTHKYGITNIKPSAAGLIDNADFIVDITEPDNINQVIDKIDIIQNGKESLVAFNGIFKDFTLIVLAGGKSSRMGTDKAALIYNGQSFLEALVRKGLLNGFNEVIISGSKSKIVGACNVDDILLERGPLAGIHASLKAAKCKYCLVLAVDTPKLDFDDLVQMAEFHLESGKKATILTSNGKLDPLIGIYNSDLHYDIAELIKDGPKRIKKLLDIIPCGFFDFKGNIETLANINTPKDYELL